MFCFALFFDLLKAFDHVVLEFMTVKLIDITKIKKEYCKYIIMIITL